MRVGGMHDGGRSTCGGGWAWSGRVWQGDACVQETRPLKWAACILPECIVVGLVFVLYGTDYFFTYKPPVPMSLIRLINKLNRL